TWEVHGLTSFIDDHADLLLDHELYDTKLIIDGSNLYHFIYFNHNVTATYGGDYNVFAIRTRQVFQTFLACNVQPYVVFDGAYSRDDKKLGTVVDRARKKILCSASVAKGGRGKILPLLAYDTFIFVLNELQIPHMTCDQEADDQIVLLANEYNCPVLSCDSDFYIFDLTGGYIPMDYLAFEATKSSDKKYSYLPCQFYHVDSFVKSFEGLTKNNLPLVATVLGNDFFEGDAFERFLAKLNMPKTLGKDHKTKDIISIKLFHWLASLDNPESAEEEIVKFLNVSQQVKMRELMKSYRYMKSDFDLPEFFEKRQDFHAPTYLKGYNGTELPEWLVSKVRRAELPVFMMNIITLHSIFLQCQVEHTPSPSAWACSDKVRKVLYGILLKDDLSETNSRAAESKRSVMVEEYSRDIKNCRKSFLNPCLTLPDFGVLPGLTELPRMDMAVRKKLFVESLALDERSLSPLCPTLTLHIVCVIFWVRESDPKITDSHVKSLLVCLIYLFVKRNINKTTFTRVDKSSGKDYELDLESSFISSTDAQLQGLKTNLDKFAVQPVHNHKSVINPEVINGFAQFQACLLMIKYLNKLLGHPIQDANPENFFNGSFLYNLCRNLETRPLPDLFLSEVLVRGSPLHQCFQRLEDLVLRNLSPDEVPVQKPRSAKPRKGSKGRKSKESPRTTEDTPMNADVYGDLHKSGKVRFEAACDLQNRFACFSVEGDFD
ncbi:LOW QUALITY PROTEIN: protein asteroid homolog 1-like, partial [Liolophura sinensis]|uniref:LOW QUALITY PROTEIN: protein asteroid homolog 1-like n=1 Tax=Liolophura sinensis TaxID=3198878 RepID=UPI0031580892